MYKVFQPIINLVKTKYFTISDTFFILNTEVTPILLLMFSILLTSVDCLRASIDCYTDVSSNNRKAIMDNYCFSTGTFVCKNGSTICSNQSDKIYQNYYQWIPLILIIQAGIMYLPAHLWRKYECGLIQNICTDLGT